MSANNPAGGKPRQQCDEIDLSAEAASQDSSAALGEFGSIDAGDDSAEELSDCGFADPEGLMLERPDYWTSLPAPLAPHEPWLKRWSSRFLTSLQELGLMAPREAMEERVSDEEWAKLYEKEFGQPSKQAANLLDEGAAPLGEAASAQALGSGSGSGPSGPEAMLGGPLQPAPDCSRSERVLASARATEQRLPACFSSSDGQGLPPEPGTPPG